MRDECVVFLQIVLEVKMVFFNSSLADSFAPYRNIRDEWFDCTFTTKRTRSDGSSTGSSRSSQSWVNLCGIIHRLSVSFKIGNWMETKCFMKGKRRKRSSPAKVFFRCSSPLMMISVLFFEWILVTTWPDWTSDWPNIVKADRTLREDEPRRIAFLLFDHSDGAIAQNLGAPEMVSPLGVASLEEFIRRNAAKCIIWERRDQIDRRFPRQPCDPDLQRGSLVEQHIPRSNMTARKWSFTDRKRLSDEDSSTLGNRSTKSGSLRGLLGPFTDQTTNIRAARRKGCPFTTRFKQFFNGTLVKSPEVGNCLRWYSFSFLPWSRWSKYLKIPLQKRKNVERNSVASAICIPVEKDNITVNILSVNISNVLLQLSFTD